MVLLTLAAGQFLMTLDSSVMNVSIATVAKDVGTTVTGIQTAITLYTLVMASLMITGGKIGQIFGRKRVFAIGCVIYGCGSFVTSSSVMRRRGWVLLASNCCHCSQDMPDALARGSKASLSVLVSGMPCGRRPTTRMP
jgi:MFS family permease